MSMVGFENYVNQGSNENEFRMEMYREFEYNGDVDESHVSFSVKFNPDSDEFNLDVLDCDSHHLDARLRFSKKDVKALIEFLQKKL